MNKLFEQSKAFWVKYSDYVINETANGVKYLQAALQLSFPHAETAVKHLKQGDTGISSAAKNALRSGKRKAIPKEKLSI